jgi:sigma-E factor negative regulatory protein RseA
VNQDEVESQLSAMFDGALPAAECELLSRRMDRDENLRSRWSRYALIGAAMRSEPVATARSGFASRVSAAIEASGPRRRLRRGSLVVNGALAATLVAGVAGLGVSMLREVALRGGDGAPSLVAASTVSTTVPVGAQPAVAGGGSARATGGANDSPFSPVSYVNPTGTPGVSTILRSQLADYIVAHSAYSTPLLRRNVLSELMTSEDQLGIASSFAGAAGAAQGTLAGGGDASRFIPAARH